MRYSFQAAVYAIWRERNMIKHGEKATSIIIPQKLVDKGIRNKLSMKCRRERTWLRDSNIGLVLEYRISISHLVFSLEIGIEK